MPVIRTTVRPVSNAAHAIPSLAPANDTLISSTILNARRKRHAKRSKPSSNTSQFNSQSTRSKPSLNASQFNSQSTRSIAVSFVESEYLHDRTPTPLFDTANAPPPQLTTTNSPSPLLVLPDRETFHSRAQETKRRQKKKCRAYLKCLIPLLCIALALIIGGSLFAALYKPATTTKTSTTTTTTSTSATTTTTTTSTTSTTTTTSTSTSTTTSTTSTSTSSTSTSTTSETTTTETTSTTTTTDTTTPTTTACYFGGDFVHLVEGGQRQISRLRAGDRVWSLSEDGQHLIADEVMVIPHAGPKTLTEFYTFTTVEGQTISLTDTHFLVIFDDGKARTASASKVTVEHRLVLYGRTVPLQSIHYSSRVGFYSPITISGYLLVNNLSTSVYSDFFHASHAFHHHLGGFARVYYNITKWMFGRNYHPFGSTVSEELHPISTLVIQVHDFVQVLSHSFLLPILIIGIIYAAHRKDALSSLIQ